MLPKKFATPLRADCGNNRHVALRRRLDDSLVKAVVEGETWRGWKPSIGSLGLPEVAQPSCRPAMTAIKDSVASASKLLSHWRILPAGSLGSRR